MPITRRRVLSGAAVAGAGVVAAPLLGGVAAAAPALDPVTDPAETHSLADVQHVVFLMMENRSFDHIFGTLSGVRGFDDRTITRPKRATGDDGNIFAQYDAVTGKYELPFLLSDANDGQDTPDLSHEWTAQHLSLNGGTNDNWIAAHRAADGATAGPTTMGYYTRAELPYHYQLADTFTVCDTYFCSVLGPTYPNRMMWQMGSIDPLGLGGGPLLNTAEAIFTDSPTNGVFSKKYATYPEALTAAGVTWKAWTEEGANHLYNMFPAFNAYSVGNSTSTTDKNAMTNYTNGSSDSSTEAFIAAAEAGTLPQVSWIFPSAGNSEHPALGPNTGPSYYDHIIQSLVKSKSWNKTVLFFTYDENDGFFDHVPPPLPVRNDPTVDTTLEFLGANTTPFGTTTKSTDTANTLTAGITGPVGLGFRVPTIVISPWSVGGYVNSEVLDHVSGLKFVAKRFGVPLDGIVSPWRLNVVGDMTSTLDFSKSRNTTPDLTKLTTAYALSQKDLTNKPNAEVVPTTGTMPTQESTITYPRPRVGPMPSYLIAADAPAALPEVGAPAMMVAVALATSAVAATRIRRGGRSSVTNAVSITRDRKTAAMSPAQAADDTIDNAAV